MKYPTRNPQERQSYHLDHTFYDHETVKQDDGNIIAFSYRSDEHEKGWQFSHLEDECGFMIWDDAYRLRKWDDKITLNDFLLQHPCDLNDSVFLRGRKINLNKDEKLIGYKFGGVLSSRWGVVVVNVNEPNKILRSLRLAMS